MARSTGNKKSKTEATDTAPQVVVQCTNGSCSEAGTSKTVDAGLLVGEGIMLNGTLSCVNCGSSVAVLAGTP